MRLPCAWHRCGLAGRIGNVAGERCGVSASERELGSLWHEIDALLACARATCPLQQSDALLDLDRLPGDMTVPLLAKLARAVESWEGRLLLRAPDDALAPEVRAGDHLVLDPAIAAGDDQLIVA